MLRALMVRPNNRLDWLMPSIADILFLSFFFKLLSIGSGLLVDGDTGWHIVTGESILRTFRVPFADPYSHSVSGASWTAHEWLAEVLFGLSHRFMGLNGVVLVSTAVITLTFFFLYLFMLHRRVGAVVAVSFTILAAWASMLHWLARPHIFSIPLTLAFVVILDTYQREKVNRLWLLPPLMVLWVNLHGGYVLGLILVVLYTGGNLLRSFTTSDSRKEAQSASKALGVTAVATLGATFVNPHGPAILYFPFHLIGRQYIMDNVVEWLSPNFHQYTAFEFMLLLFIAVFALSKIRPDVIEGGTALLLTYMALYSVRYVPLLAVVVTPMAATRAGEVFDQLTQPLTSLKLIDTIREIVRKVSLNVTSLETRFVRHLWVYVALTACFLVAANGGRFGKTQAMDYQPDRTTFPVEALDFALNNDIKGNMFNNDGWGGYIIYKSFPRFKVFMDGRSDMYGVPLLKEYVRVATAQIDCEKVLDKYDVTWIIFNANSPLCQLLAERGNWKLVYADTTANILLKDIPENRELIDKYPDVTFQAKDEME
jgi:hypothetical protein